MNSIEDPLPIRKLEADRDSLAKIRTTVRKTGLSKSRVQEIVDELISEVSKESYAKNLPSG